MAIDSEREFRDRFDAGYDRLTVSPAPVTEVFRQARVVRLRRRMLASVAVAAVVAAAGFVVPFVLRHPTRLAPVNHGRPVVPVRRIGVQGAIHDVAVLSARSAWAVGNTKDGKTLIERWNGIAWKRVPSPDPPGGASLNSVAATSARNAWAVGSDPHQRSVTLHWDGTAWKQVPSPSDTARCGDLCAALAVVQVTSAHDAWASGASGGLRLLVVRWDGAAWRREPSPGPADSAIYGMSATSARNAWAVGETNSFRALIFRWNGTGWKQVPCPSPPGSNIHQVSAPSDGIAWAVGTANRRGTRALILRWNGSSWRRMPAPRVAESTQLGDIAASPAGDAWLYGRTGRGDTVVYYWNGSGWKPVPLPPVAGARHGITISSVNAMAADNAWMVGRAGSDPRNVVILHWDGVSWK